MPWPASSTLGSDNVSRNGPSTLDNLRFVDYRPLSGYAKLRFKDEWEVIVDVYDSRIFSSSERRDVWVEQLHSGLLFGEGWTILSDAGAVMLILLSVNGIYLMALPGWRTRGQATAPTDDDASMGTDAGTTAPAA